MIVIFPCFELYSFQVLILLFLFCFCLALDLIIRGEMESWINGMDGQEREERKGCWICTQSRELKSLCVKPIKAHETRVPSMCENNRTKDVSEGNSGRGSYLGSERCWCACIQQDSPLEEWLDGEQEGEQEPQKIVYNNQRWHVQTNRACDDNSMTFTLKPKAHRARICAHICSATQNITQILLF